MLRSVKSLANYKLAATDGPIGNVHDFLFDDRQWTVRYMVADTGDWLPDRKVLISPISLDKPEWETQLFPVQLTKKEIEQSPRLDTDAPVSRDYEIRWFDQFGWHYYWTGSGVWGTAAYPGDLFSRQEKEAALASEPDPESTSNNLRSTNEVMRYTIQAHDGQIGHVEDFILDDATWSIRYMVVDTRTWLPGRKVLVAPEWIDSVTWAEQVVKVGLTRDALKNSPEYDPAEPVNREYEARLYDYYGRPRYW